MNFFIRDFRQSDLDGVTRIYQNSFAESPWFENWSYEDAKLEIESFLRKTNPQFLVAETKNNLIGFRIAYELSLEEFSFLDNLVKENEAMYGKELAVKKENRGEGVGTSLMLSSFDRARNQGYKKFFGRTNLKSKMVPLYKKLGYINTGIRDPAYPERVYFIKEL